MGRKKIVKTQDSEYAISYNKLSDNEKNKLVFQYEPLINKITKQFFDKVKIQWGDIKSMAYEGFVLAIKNYDPARSKMSFTQFAGFAIRNNILTSLDNELRTIKLSNYAQKKAVENGESTFNTISIDQPVRNNKDDEGIKPRESVMNMYEDAKFSDGDVFEYLYSKIESKFNDRDCKIFYMSFGMKDYDELKGKDIAKIFGVSEGLVSQRLKKIINFIRSDRDTCEMLNNLL